MLRLGAFLLVVALIGVACSTGPAEISPAPARTLPDDPTAPYGITAIDYHFHDSHPTPALAMDRTVRWVNGGQVKHNVTIPGTGFSRNLDPRETVVIHDIGKFLGGPGRYPFFCRFHVGFDPPMDGTLVVTSG